MVKIDREFMKRVYEHADNGYISRRQHPKYPELWIYNYTNACACDRVWDDVTKTCRGLILKHNFDEFPYTRADRYDVEVIAKPFPKFFNYQEHIDNGWPIPNEPFEVTEKMDGSLGIIFHYDDKWHVATRGSFDSEQAIKAKEILDYKFGLAEIRNHWTLDENKVYLVEIIYPDNRVVVNYEGKEDLVLLAVVDRSLMHIERTAKEYDSPILDNVERRGQVDFPMPMANMVFNLGNEDQRNREGVVIRFKSGARVKVKFDEYVRLHRIITGVTDKRIWEGLRDGCPLTRDMRAVEGFPDEIYAETEAKELELFRKHAEIFDQAKLYYDNGPFTECFANSDRKFIAEYFKKYKYPTILFNLLDKKPCGKFIWKLLRPKANETKE